MSDSRLKNCVLLAVKATGDQELARDFTYIDDVVSGVLGSLRTAPPSIKGKATYRLFNLGNTNPVTVTDFVTELEGALGLKANREYIPVPNLGDVLITHANVTAAHEAFGYSPKTSLREGLGHFATWYFEYYGKDGRQRQMDDSNYRPV